MSARKFRLAECNPRWAATDAVTFDCPEGHEGCHHTIPFFPPLDGSPPPASQCNGVQWQRAGDTFDTLTLAPSIRRQPSYQSKEDAIAAGCLPEYVMPTLLCALHVFVRDGAIEFCGDSR